MANVRSKYSDGLSPQVAIGEDEDVASRRGLLDRLAHVVDIRARSDIDCDARRCRVRQIAQHGRAIHDDIAFLAAVVVENIDHTKGDLRASQRKRDGCRLRGRGACWRMAR